MKKRVGMIGLINVVLIKLRTLSLRRTGKNLSISDAGRVFGTRPLV